MFPCTILFLDTFLPRGALAHLPLACLACLTCSFLPPPDRRADAELIVRARRERTSDECVLRGVYLYISHPATRVILLLYAVRNSTVPFGTFWDTASPVCGTLRRQRCFRAGWPSHWLSRGQPLRRCTRRLCPPYDQSSAHHVRSQALLRTMSLGSRYLRRGHGTGAIIVTRRAWLHPRRDRSVGRRG